MYINEMMTSSKSCALEYFSLSLLGNGFKVGMFLIKSYINLFLKSGFTTSKLIDFIMI